MRAKSKISVLFFLLLAACVPDNAGTSLAFAETASREAPASAVGNYIFYLQAKQDQDYDSAIKFLKATIKEDPSNKILVSELFTLLTIEGRIAEAAPYAREELKSDPSSLLAVLVLTVQDARENKYREALNRLEVFPNRDDNPFLIPLLEAWLYAGLDEPKKAKQALEKVNQKGTESFYYFHLALLNDMWGDSEEAEKNYEALLHGPGILSLRTVQTYGNFLLRRNDQKKFMTLIEAYRRGNRSYPLIEEDFFLAGASSGAKKIPMSVPTPKAGLAEVFFGVSGSLADKSSPESSLLFIRFSLNLDPSLSLARVLLGEVLEQQGRLNEALELYESEPETSETYFPAQMRTAMLLAKKGETEKAEKILQNLSQMHPSLPLPWVQMGDMFVAEKNFPMAIRSYTTAIEKIGTPQKSHWTLFYSRGIAYEQNNQWDLAEQDFLQALILSPEQPLTLNYLGYSWLERGKNVVKAREMLELAAFRAPQSSFITDSLGWAYYLMKDYKKAVPVLEAAVSQDPGSAVINDHLGDAYWRSGRRREARYQWRKALDVNDDLTPEDRARVEAKLEKGLDAIGDKVTVPEAELKSVIVKNEKNAGK